ncbi:MAG: ABC transporter permease [Bacillota bacterium]
MKGLAFLMKEIKEILKTHKIFILPAVFLFFAFSSPLTAKYINEILKSIGGVDITLPEPTYLDSYAQFFKNFNSICMIVLILSFMGTVVDEKVKGSVILVLTKHVSRMQFVTSKFIAAVVFFTVSYALSALACIYYTYLLFPKFYNENLWLSIVLFWIYGVFVISITVFSSTISKSHMMAAIFGFIGYIAAPLITYIPVIGRFTPGQLESLSMDILTGVKTVGDTVGPVIVTLLVIMLFLTGSVMVFRKQEV